MEMLPSAMNCCASECSHGFSSGDLFFLYFPKWGGTGVGHDFFCT